MTNKDTGSGGPFGDDLPKVPPPPLEVLLYQAETYGILPLTSTCNLACAFCSAAGNPPGLETFSIRPRSLEDIRRHIPYLAGSRGPIVIGESVTRVIEGEPLSHPEFSEVMRVLREAFPEREIRLTTNGTLLTAELSRVLKEMDATMIVSLNTKDPELRKRWMKDPDPRNTLRQLELLASTGVRFEGSIVALAGLFGLKDIEETTRYLIGLGAHAVRLLLPGFSRYHQLAAIAGKTPWRDVRDLARELTGEAGVPVVADPPELPNLEARIEGCLRDSPARAAGLRPGDVILRVNDTTVFSRRHAMELSRSARQPVLTVYRDGRTIQVTLPKGKSSPPGFVVYDDVGKSEVAELEARIRKVGTGRVLVLTSCLAASLVSDVAARFDLDVKVMETRSEFFGGNIAAAGLLVVSDFLGAFVRLERTWVPDLVVLPRRAFDVWGRDLTGVPYKAFSSITGVPVVLAG